VNLPGSVTIPTGSLGQQFCYTLDSNYDWRQVFDIRAQLGAETVVAYGSQAYTFGFSESIAQNSNAYVYAGSVYVYVSQSTPPITVALTSSQAYSSTVQLSCQGLPPGGSCTFGSTTLGVSPTAPVSTTVIINTSSAVGTDWGGDVTIVASDPNVTTRQSVNLQIRTLFIVGGGGGGSTAISPGAVAGDLTISGIPPFTASCSGLPAGVTCSISGTPSPNPNSESDLALNIDIPAGIAPGSYDYTIQVTSGPVAISQKYTLNIVDFSLQPPAAGSAWDPPGGTVNVSLTVQPINNFQQFVTLTCSLDITAICMGDSFTVFGTSPSSANLSVSLPPGAAPGAHTLTATVTGGQLSRSVAFPFYVADYSGSLSAPTLTMQHGGSGSLSATVNATNGFGGVVSFSCSGSSPVTCSFSPATVQPTATSPQTVTITINASDSASTLPFTDSTRSRFLLLAFILAFGIVFGAANKRRVHVARAAVGIFLLALLLLSLSCGAGSGGGSGGGGTGGSGSNTYAITVNATAAGTNTTRTLGTVSVTVTH
jgi:hypothetical protein